MNSISILKNSVQTYAWGSYTAIPELLGTESPSSDTHRQSFGWVLNFNEGETDVLPVTHINRCERIYLSRAEEFVLSVINLQEDTTYHSPSNRSGEILLCTAGNALIFDLASRVKIDLSKGSSILIPTAVEKYRISGDATIYKAAVPISES